MSNKKSNCWLSLYKKIVRSTYKETNFVQQLCLTIIDKLFIALLIVAAVSCINIYQEKIKAKELFSNEIAKRRVEVISTIWTRMFEWESAINDVIVQASEIHKTYENDPKLEQTELKTKVKPLFDKAVKLREGIKPIVENNFFWLGKNLSKEFNEYHNNLVDLFNAASKSEKDKYYEATKRINASRPDVDTILRKIGK